MAPGAGGIASEARQSRLGQGNEIATSPEYADFIERPRPRL